MNKKWVAMGALAMAALLLASCKGKEAQTVLTTVPDPWKEEVPATLPYSVLTAHQAGDKIFTGNEWTGKPATGVNGSSKQQVEVVSANAMDYHSSETLMYQSVEAARLGAINYEYERSNYYQLLTGEGKNWSLAVYENITDAKKAGVYDQFYTTDYDMTTAPKYEGNNTVGTYETAYYGGFKDVTLPASWQTQGFDFPIYSNYTYPWNTYKNGDVRLPNAPTQTNPVGFYRTTFTVDEGWLKGDRSTYIAFGGVDSCYYVWVNGYQVGYAEGSYDLSEFDLTPYLNYDGSENVLAVMVIRWCDGSYFENQDFLRLAGIFRDVWLYSTPGVQIYDYSVVTDLDSTYTNATLKINLDLLNKTMATIPGKFSVDVKLFDADGNNLFAADPLTASMTGELASGKTETMKITREVKAPHLWSDEDPYLYITYHIYRVTCAVYTFIS